MELALETRSPSEARADVLVLGQYGDGARPAPEIAALDRALGGLLSRVQKSEKFEGKPGQISYFHTAGAIPAERVLVVGLGPLRRGARARDAEPVRRATAAAVRRARDLGAATISVFMPATALAARARAQAVVEGALLGTYRFDKYLKEKSPKSLDAFVWWSRSGAASPRRRRGCGPEVCGRPRPVSPAIWSTSPPTWSRPPISTTTCSWAPWPRALTCCARSPRP